MAKTKLKDLESDVIAVLGVLGGLVILLLCLVIGLYVWNYKLTQRVKKAEDPLKNFKISRPKLRHEERPPPPINYAYDNPNYQNQRERDHNSLPNRQLGQPSLSGQNNSLHSSLNPVANRQQNVVNNDNFSFGSHFAADDDSYRKPSHSILNRESKYY